MRPKASGIFPSLHQHCPIQTLLTKAESLRNGGHVQISFLMLWHPNGKEPALPGKIKSPSRGCIRSLGGSVRLLVGNHKEKV